MRSVEGARGVKGRVWVMLHACHDFTKSLEDVEMRQLQ